MERVVDNDAQGRYELERDGERIGLITYSDRDGARVLEHTEVDEEHRNDGLGSRLVEGALEDVRRRGKHVVPQCAFVRDFLERRPEFRDLVA